MQNHFYLYILKCKNGAYYVGHTDDWNEIKNINASQKNYRGALGDILQQVQDERSEGLNLCLLLNKRSALKGQDERSEGLNLCLLLSLSKHQDERSG
jgi:hypothetical protein